MVPQPGHLLVEPGQTPLQLLARVLMAAADPLELLGHVLVQPACFARRTTLGEISFVDPEADNNTSASIAAKHKELSMPDKTAISDPNTATADTVTPGPGDAGGDGSNAGNSAQIRAAAPTPTDHAMP